MTLHILKTWPEYFEAVGSGRKTFEVRARDRDYQEGDHLGLIKWDPVFGRYSDVFLVVEVTYVLPGGQFGIGSGHCVMAIRLDPLEDWVNLAEAEQVRAYIRGLNS